MGGVAFNDPRVPAHHWRKITPCPMSGCWIWCGAASVAGYGIIRAGSRFDDSRHLVRAHRVIWSLVNGDPGDALVLHRCDVRLCVNPSHLFLGDHVENQRDKITKGRQARGASHGATRIHQDAAAEMIRRHRSGERIASIARAFNVSWAAVKNVIVGDHWTREPWE